MVDMLSRLWHLVYRVPDGKFTLLIPFTQILFGQVLINVQSLVLYGKVRSKRDYTTLDYITQICCFSEQINTLMIIFPFSWVGEGSCSASGSNGSVKSLSWKTSLNTWAIIFCCLTSQCSSMDSTTGYLSSEHHVCKHHNMAHKHVLLI